MTGDEFNKMNPAQPLSQRQIEALRKNAPTPDDIFKNMDELNQEIIGTYPTDESVPPIENELAEELRNLTKGNEPKVKPVQVEPKMKTLEEELAEMNKMVDAAAKKVEAEAPVEDAKEESEASEGDDSIRSQLLELLEKTPGAPSAAQIQAWKDRYGQNGVHLLGLGEGDVYIFTHLTRGQWQAIQKLMSKAQEAQVLNDIEESMKEKIIGYCTLWPRPLPPEFFFTSRAGVVDDLHQAILFNSYFLQPQQIMMLTTQL